ISLAMLHYHEAHGQLPVGIVGCGAIDVNGYYAVNGTTAFALILPYLEQGNVAANYDYKARNLMPSNKEIVGATIPCYVCPSDNARGRIAIHMTHPSKFSRSNYVFCMGSNAMVRNARGNNFVNCP